MGVASDTTDPSIWLVGFEIYSIYIRYYSFSWKSNRQSWHCLHHVQLFELQNVFLYCEWGIKWNCNNVAVLLLYLWDWIDMCLLWSWFTLIVEHFARYGHHSLPVKCHSMLSYQILFWRFHLHAHSKSWLEFPPPSTSLALFWFDKTGEELVKLANWGTQHPAPKHNRAFVFLSNHNWNEIHLSVENWLLM